jgi:hypothetical protein
MGVKILLRNYLQDQFRKFVPKGQLVKVWRR